MQNTALIQVEHLQHCCTAVWFCRGYL